MTISIDTGKSGYDFVSGIQRSLSNLTPSVLNQKISVIETKHSDLRFPADQNSKLTEVFSEADEIPDVTKLNLQLANHILGEEKVIPLIT
jgi:hypothetical protein